MKLLYCLAAFIAVASAAPFAPCNQNITISSPWLMPSTLVAPNSQCTYTFSIPSDSYAVLSLSATGAVLGDQLVAWNHFMDSYAMDTNICGSNCDPFNLKSKWPTDFMVTYTTLSTTAMKIQMGITLKKFNPTANIVQNITTATNADSSLIYFSNVKPGTSYQITSKNSKVNFKVPIAWQSYSLSEIAKQSNIFIYDGGVCTGTLQSKIDYTSQSKTIILYVVDTIDLRGAVFLTDDSNIAELENHGVYYAPVFYNDHTGFATIDGLSQPQIQEGAVTIVGDETKSSLTVRMINNFGEGGNFSYLYGGPHATHNTNPLTGNSLPRTLSKSQMWTFYISQGMGNIKYTINI